MLKIGGRPILETILETFIAYGFRRFYISVNYKADVIMDYFRDGSRWQVQITYLQENKRLGTAGALSLLPEKPMLPLIVMNGDILTKINFNHLLDFHNTHKAKATMCVSDYEYQVPFGVITLNGHQIMQIQEKPTQKFFINAGIYALDPDVLDLVPKDDYDDMTTLFQRVSAECGCGLPFRRPPELAADDTPGVAPVLHALEHLPGCDYVVLLQPTSPLRLAEDIDGCIQLCVQRGAPACVSVTKCQEHPWLLFRLESNLSITPLLAEGSQIASRQPLPRFFRVN